MSDITLNYRSAELLAPAKAGAAAASGPLGLRATLVWGLAAYAAMWSPLLIEWMLQAMWGADAGLPRLLNLLPTGHIAAAAVVMIALWRHGRSLREYIALAPMGRGGVARGIGYGILGFIGLGMMFILIAIVQMAFGAEPATAPTIVKVPFNMQTLIGLASLWFGMVVAAPIVEEMLFRGLMYRGLVESRIGVIGAMLITSVVFGLAHYPGFGWSRVIATGCAGLFFAWLRWYYGNTSMGMVAHAMTNTIGATALTFAILA
jgi:membrane protease YdiL (CAAX protease family)